MRAPSLDALTTPVLWADPDGMVLGCNPAFAGWLGASVRRLQGLALATLDAEDGRLAEALARQARSANALHLRRARLRALSGGERFAELWLWRDGDGQILLEAHPAEEFPGEDPVTALPAALSAALKGLAHELRNPLAGLQGAAQLLARRLEGEPERELLALIRSEVERLTSLLDRLMTPTPPRPPQPTNIHLVLERVRQLAEAEAGWTIKIERDYDPSLPEIAGDPDRLTQALWNLVRNAMESGAGAVALRTRAEHNVLIGERSYRLALRVEIADDGRGVPEDLAERIFLPLVSGRAQGTGLGLPLAQQVAREHGGSLGYRSRPGHTVFSLLLPALDAAEVADAPR
jgi:two-component system nitrogen regulation sensor histidine kinase GlnL